MLQFLIYCLSEGFTNLLRSRVLNLLSIGTMMLAVFILGAFLLLGTNLERTISTWKDRIQFHLFLDDNISQDELGQIKRALDENAEVLEWHPISKEEAWAVFAGENPSLMAFMDPTLNPFPASLMVTLRLGAQADSFNRLKAQLSPLPGVEEIHYDLAFFARLRDLTGILHWVAAVLGSIVGFASIFTVSNVLKLTFFSRRDEVDIMKLVGASRAYIRGPFMVEGLLQGLIGAAAGLALLFLATELSRRYLTTQTGQLLHPLDLAFLPPSWTLALLGGGLVVGVGGAAISLNQFLKEHISYQ